MRNIDTKVSFNGQTRDVDFSENFQILCHQIAVIFGIERFTLKYRDEEGDLVTLTSDAELQHAYSSAIPLHVEVFLTVSPPVSGVQPVQAPVGQQPPFAQQPVYGHPPAHQPLISAPQAAPALYPTAPQYAMPVYQQPPQQQPIQQPVYGQPFPPQPVYGQYPIQPAYGQPLPQPVYPAQVALGKMELKALDKVDKAQRKMEKMDEKHQKKADKAQRKAEKRGEKTRQQVSMLQAQPGSVAPPSPTTFTLVNVPQTPVFPPAPQAVWTKTPAGVFYSQSGPRATEMIAGVPGTVQPVPYFYSIEFLDPPKRVLMPGDHFVQRWRVRNEGTYAWPTGMMLMYDPCPKHGAASFSGPNFLTIDQSLGPKEEAVLSFRLVVPPAPGRYVGLWKMCTPDLMKFGKKIKIVVKAPTPENAEREMQKAIRKASVPIEERRSLKAAKKAAKAEAKQRYREAKMVAKQSGDKDAKHAAKLACREAKKQAKMEHKEAKLARKMQIATVHVPQENAYAAAKC